ncbi:MAG: purine permease, partial [Prevotellamassilia sp.]|nr:purine permease [Prevotellamassilia sp.]
EMLSRCGFGLRNMVIVSVSISAGIGFSSNPAIFAHFPSIVQIIFAGNSVAIVFVVAVLLNLLIPKKFQQEE